MDNHVRGQLSREVEHLFKYYTAEVAKIVLTTGRVRWSSPLLLNDPFDCYFSPEVKFDVAASQEKHCERFLGLMFQADEPAFIPEHSFVQELRKLRQAAHRKGRSELRRIFLAEYPLIIEGMKALSQEVRAEWKSKVGNLRLFCLCEINDNLLLWSHYTKCHTGAVFQFECSSDPNALLLAAVPVRYTDEAPGFLDEDGWLEVALGLRPFDPDDDTLFRLVTTKARVWEHEKEWRAVRSRRIDSNEGCEYHPFLSQELSKVFLGCRMGESDKKDILELLGGPFAHVQVYEANQNPTKFGLLFEQIR